MEHRKKRIVLKIALFFTGLTVLVLSVTGGIYHKAVKAVWYNLTAKKLSLPDMDDWTGGKTYLQVPYANLSKNQYVDIYVPDTDNPKLFVLIHGGGFITNDSQSRQVQLMYRFFRDHGYACASVNYRLAQEASFPGALEDCKAAIRFLRSHADEYGYNADSIAVFGESAGGYLATMCAVTGDGQFNRVPHIMARMDQKEQKDALQKTGQDESVSAKVDVLVDYYGHIDNEGAKEDWKVLEIPDLVLNIANSWVRGDVLEGYENVESFWMRKNISEMSQEEKQIADPHWYIDQNDLTGLNAWIIHGDADITVPVLQSVRLAEHLERKKGIGNVELTIVPGVGHAGDMLYSDDVLEKLKEYLDEHM